MMNWLRRNVEPARDRVDPVIGNMADVSDVVVSSDREGMLRLFMDMPTDAGAVVTSGTAMRVSAVYACVRLIAGAIGALPVDIYKRDSDGNSMPVHNHDLWWLFNESASPQFSSTAFKEFIVSQMLLRGDAFVYIVRNPRTLAPESFLPLRREQVIVERVAPKDPRQQPRLVYYVTTPDGAFGVEQEDMLHFPGLGFNGMTSLSVIQWGARNGIGIAIRADEFAGKFFSQGAQPQHAITTAKKMEDKQQEQLRAAWVAKYTGNGPNGVPLILTEGMDVKQLTMSAVDAQLLETRKWQIEDIARAFGVPPHLIGVTEKATSFGSGLEQLGQGLINYTLAPHFGRIENECNRKLFRRAGTFLRWNVDGLMRGDATARANYYKSALGGTQNPAWMTPNQVRKLENQPPMPGGDELAKPQPKGPNDPPNGGSSEQDPPTPGK